MLFLKTISDRWKDHQSTYRQQYGADERRIRRHPERERFILPAGASFDDLYARRNASSVGELINMALEAIEDVNRAKLAAPKPGDTICDPAFDSGSLPIQASQAVGSPNFALYGQEVNGTTWPASSGCDTTNSPRMVAGDHLIALRGGG